MKRAAEEDNDERLAQRRRDEQDNIRQYSTSSDASEGHQGVSGQYKHQVSISEAAMRADGMPDNRHIVSTMLGLQTSSHPSTSSMSSNATARVSNMSNSNNGGIARPVGGSYGDSSVAITYQQATSSVGVQGSLFPSGMPSNRFIVSTSGQETSHPSTSSIASASPATVSSLSNHYGGTAHQQQVPQPAASLLSSNPILNVPPFGFIPDQSSSPVLDRQELHRQQVLAQLAVAQTISDAQRIGGSLADPALLSALDFSPPLPLNIPILGALSPRISPPILDTVLSAAISQAGAILLAQQQQQRLLLQQNTLLSSMALPESASSHPAAAAPATTASSASSTRRYVTTQSGEIDTSLPPAPPVGNLLGPVRTTPLSMPRDIDILSDHQILLRRQIEFFEARPADIHHFCPGRRREISVGQVGIRCKCCAAAGVQAHERTKGCVYFPSTLRALYQAAQNMGTTHFLEHCPKIPVGIKEQLGIYTGRPTNSGYGGKKYWANGALSRGIYETNQGLRFHSNVT